MKGLLGLVSSAISNVAGVFYALACFTKGGAERAHVILCDA
jgi:hypothetical protein